MRLLRGGAVILGHLALGSIVSASIWGSHWIFTILWGDNDPKFFDRIPIRWFFDASELGVMLLFIGMGLVEAFRQLRQ